MICYYFFFNHGFEFQYSLCNGCHDFSMLCLNISNIAIITVKRVDYRCVIYKISKSEAINLLENSVLEDLSLNSVLDLFRIYKMVDNMCIHKSLNINIGAVMKNPEMIKFIPDTS